MGLGARRSERGAGNREAVFLASLRDVYVVIAALEALPQSDISLRSNLLGMLHDLKHLKPLAQAQDDEFWLGLVGVP